MEKINISPDWVFSPQPMYIVGTKNEDVTPYFCIITWLGFSFDNGPHLMMNIVSEYIREIQKRFSSLKSEIYFKQHK